MKKINVKIICVSWTASFFLSQRIARNSTTEFWGEKKENKHATNHTLISKVYDEATDWVAAEENFPI